MAALKNILAGTVLTIISFAFTYAKSGQTDTGWQHFNEKLAQADMLEIYLGYPEKDAKIVYKSKDPKDISEFIGAAKIIVPKQAVFAGTVGKITTKFYKDGEELISVMNIGAYRIRCSDFAGDANLVNADKLAKWFDKRNVYKVREDLCRSIAARNRETAERKLWKSAMPKSVEALWNDAMYEKYMKQDELAAAYAAISSEISDEIERAITLFGWLGANNGEWANFIRPYESIPYYMLYNNYPKDKLAEIAETRDLDECQLEGAARFFESIRDLELSDNLKNKLLKHTLKSTNANKIFKAKRSFDD